MTDLRRQEGQVTVLVAVFMVVLIGMAGFVIDVGSWFRQQRVTQSTVDAAALAAAQSLPEDTSRATNLATAYADANDGVAGASITFSSRYSPNDTVTVSKAKPADGFFSKLFGVDTVSIKAKASAVSAVPTKARFVAPIVVNIKHPFLSGSTCPCFNQPTTLPLGKAGAPGAFDLVNLNYGDSTGTVGASTLAAWILKGYNDYLPLGVYFSDPGAKWNNNSIQDALRARYNSDLLFPVYDTLIGTGSNAEYHIIAWAGFHVTRASAGGSSGAIDGYFTQVIWQGLISPSGPPNPGIPDLGVHSVALVD